VSKEAITLNGIEKMIISAEQNRTRCKFEIIKSKIYYLLRKKETLAFAQTK
jgi:hypothetical protein